MTRIRDPNRRPEADDQSDDARGKLHPGRETRRTLEVSAVAPHMRPERWTGATEHHLAPTESSIATHDSPRPCHAAGSLAPTKYGKRAVEFAGRPLTRFQW